ncbi:BI1-like protein [Turnera subulata]|uniref:BI1-like protein n=1 Tax=Turnera subulata TaxID=218843 RepID=A0A9Q0GEL1_9ROSI|nr:BI1-like protein [Turnera subulata]
MYGFTSVSTKEVDLEAGNGETLYPGLGLGENQLRWGLIRRVYGILAAQLVLTTAVSTVTILYTPINTLLTGSAGLLLFLSIIPFLLLWPLHVYHQKHPVNLIVLGLFTVSLSLLVGATGM